MSILGIATVWSPRRLAGRVEVRGTTLHGTPRDQQWLHLLCKAVVGVWGSSAMPPTYRERDCSRCGGIPLLYVTLVLRVALTPMTLFFAADTTAGVG